MKGKWETKTDKRDPLHTLTDHSVENVPESLTVGDEDESSNLIVALLVNSEEKLLSMWDIVI